MKNPTYKLRQTKVIRPFLATFLPEQGREFECIFISSIAIRSPYEKITGILVEYPDSAITLTVTIHRDQGSVNKLTLRITDTNERRTAPTFYKKIERYLSTQLCAPIVKEPGRADEIMRSLFL